MNWIINKYIYIYIYIHIYIYIYILDLVLNNPPGFICHKTLFRFQFCSRQVVIQFRVIVATVVRMRLNSTSHYLKTRALHFCIQSFFPSPRLVSLLEERRVLLIIVLIIVGRRDWFIPFQRRTVSHKSYHRKNRQSKFKSWKILFTFPFRLLSFKK